MLSHYLTIKIVCKKSRCITTCLDLTYSYFMPQHFCFVGVKCHCGRYVVSYNTFSSQMLSTAHNEKDLKSSMWVYLDTLKRVLAFLLVVHFLFTGTICYFLKVSVLFFGHNTNLNDLSLDWFEIWHVDCIACNRIGFSAPVPASCFLERFFLFLLITTGNKSGPLRYTLLR